MIPKSGNRFSDKIMLQYAAKSIDEFLPAFAGVNPSYDALFKKIGRPRLCA